MKKWTELSAQDVINAYRRNPDVKPRFGRFIEEDIDSDGTWKTYACALGVLTIDAGYEDGPGSGADAFIEARLPDNFRCGVIDGFDDYHTYGDRVQPRYADMYLRGRELGKAARAWVLAQ